MTKPLDLTQFDEHTPGPWNVWSSGNTMQVDGADGSGSDESAVVHWCGFDSGGREKKVKRINARLIAAAPTLLAELKSARAEIERLQADLQRERENGARLLSAIRWALGCDEGEPHFGEQPEQRGNFAWRKELRRRAALANEPKEST